MKGVETRLSKLEQARPDDDFVRLPDDLSLWTEAHWKDMAQWCECNGDIGHTTDGNGRIVLRPSPLDALSPDTLKALRDALVELQDSQVRNPGD